MDKMQRLISASLMIGMAMFLQATLNTAQATTPTPSTSFPVAVTPTRPMITPTPPAINAKGSILLDAFSGKVVASNNPDQKTSPASLTKIMTAYIASEALRTDRIHLDDQVRISEKAWRTGGSKMFVKVGDLVSVRDLLQGIIVASGNDACVAIAEHIAGSEDAFVSLMNQQATALGMTNTHFKDANGLPHPEQYTTPRDMATLARALVLNFPEDYKWYSQKWFTFNNIKQPNRNRLLWRDPSVDGIKTGHTDDAGYCLVASAVRNNMRMISVVMGAPTDSVRADESQKLLNYGFRFYETRKLYTASTPIQQTRIWFGQEKSTPLGVTQDVYFTAPIAKSKEIKITMDIPGIIKAPIQKGQAIGTLKVTLENEVLISEPIVALQDNPKGGFFSRLTDYIRLALRSLLGGSNSNTA